MIERWFEPGFTVERYTETTNELGEPVKSWNPHLTTDGRLDALTGTEQQRAAAVNVVATHIWFTYAGQDIKEQDRVKYNGRTYDVKFVDDPMNMGRHLEVLLEVVR